MGGRHHSKFCLMLVLQANALNSSLNILFASLLGLLNPLHDSIDVMMVRILLLLLAKVFKKFQAQVFLFLNSQDLLLSSSICFLQLFSQNLCTFKVILIGMAFLLQLFNLFPVLKLFKNGFLSLKLEFKELLLLSLLSLFSLLLFESSFFGSAKFLLSLHDPTKQLELRSNSESLVRLSQTENCLKCWVRAWSRLLCRLDSVTPP